MLTEEAKALGIHSSQTANKTQKEIDDIKISAGLLREEKPENKVEVVEEKTASTMPEIIKDEDKTEDTELSRPARRGRKPRKEM